MLPRQPSSRTEAAIEPEAERLVTAAARITRSLPAARPVLGILRGFSRADRDRARILRSRLAERGIQAADLSLVPEAGDREPGRATVPRPRVDVLLYAGGPQPEHAMKAAALWRLPLLIERQDGEEGGELNSLGGHRRAVLGIHLSGGAFAIAAREAVIASLQPQPGRVRLILDNEKITAPGDQPLCVTLTVEDLLRVSGDAFGSRQVRRLRFERAWGAYRLDIDGIPAHDVHAPLRIEALPGRLHLLHP
ncbi:hypothetical protein E4N62_38725 [Streptomyces sp. MNU76]|uniref:hypothetical protein n=1 Tax=Streptomyces sp. MNU76 TaxID=2560026 RepID=UPI001E3FC2AA|nr:hypothetical protein [Streptomyces sp. MNU76]MCC9710658.1 hypothetical protein [Streptomyces sp. MNU76]